MFKLISKTIQLCLLLIIAGLIFHQWTSKTLMAVGLRWALGAPVKVQDVRIDFFQGQFLFEGIEIGNPVLFPEEPLADVPKIFVDLEYSSLLKGLVRFETVELNLEAIHVIRRRDGQINLMSLKSVEQKDKKEREPAQGPLSFQIDNLILTLGRATYRDLADPGAGQSEINLRINHAVYQQVDSMTDIVSIVVWETLKGVGIRGMSAALEGLRPDFMQPNSLVDKVVQAFKDKF